MSLFSVLPEGVCAKSEPVHGGFGEQAPKTPSPQGLDSQHPG